MPGTGGRPPRPPARPVALPCACAGLRRASRAVSQLYDEALRPAGLRVTQFTILQVLAEAGELTQGALGGLLTLDGTTLTRTLALLRRRGWVTIRPGADRRERLVRLASEGRRRLERARPAWERAQERLRRSVGATGWERLMAALHDVARAASQA